MPSHTEFAAWALQRHGGCQAWASHQRGVIESVVGRTDLHDCILAFRYLTTWAPIATASSLIALKAVAIPHRSQSNRPEKVGSDIHDLVRLAQSSDFDETVASITEASAELARLGRDDLGQVILTGSGPPIHVCPTPSTSSICSTIVLQSWTVSTTTTVRLSQEERELLSELAEQYGSQTGAIRQGLLLLARESGQRRALREFLREWAEEAGSPEPEDVAAMRDRYFAS